uniref:RING-type domain-containing protein n=1 Tax=Buteo japonicus TaxID=224669 RepID=A0A8C0BFW9_9AVES
MIQTFVGLREKKLNTLPVLCYKICVICMMDFVYGDPIRFLPCMHIYHLDCIDDWLMRSFTYHPL